MSYEHLRFLRETSLTDRHRRQDKRPRFRPENPGAFGESLRLSLTSACQRADQEDVGGFDDRTLIKIQLREGESVPDLNLIPGVELLSQENKLVVLAFASQEGRTEFESRLTNLVREGKTTRAELLYALQSFDHWTSDDRLGSALRQQGFPESPTFVLDIELWPQDRPDRRDAILNAFLGWIREQGIERLDDLKQPSLIMVRMRCNREQADKLLRHRDIRTVDLPPRGGISIEILRTSVDQIVSPDAPPADAPAIAVLDSGLTSGHPLLTSAVGDAQGYLAPHRHPHDEPPSWHGTFVAGLALYGDIAECLRLGQFVPQLRLFSGKVFQDNGNNQTEFIEKAIEEAVLELNKQYGCRVFNLSYGDLNKVYDGRHVRGLAYTLDRLTRELGVLFIVPTGNIPIHELPENPRARYPDYLMDESARLLDPATALNVLTVGGLALNTATRNAQRYPNGIEDLPIAREDQPFPLSRRGFSINGAIKPDVVEHAGNLAVMRIGGRTRHDGLGVMSTCGDFAGGGLFSEDIGTSYAAPLVAHRAGRLSQEIPGASSNLLRSLLGAHARWPRASREILNPRENADGKKRLMQLIGYGRIGNDALYRSTEQTVTMITEDNIGNNKCLFYELPIPDSFWSSGRRFREITVSLAYSPEVRTTRLDYRMSKLWFTLVTATNLEEVERSFQRSREEGMKERDVDRWLSNNDRKNSTLQVSRWNFTQPRSIRRVFVVITRQDTPWGTVDDNPEPYALAVVLADRENTTDNLYALTKAKLEQRAQARARTRV